MHYINIIDYAYPDDLFMFLSARVNSSNIQRNNGWTLCKVNDKELTVKNLSGYISEYIWEIVLPKKCMFLLNKCEKITYEIRRDILVRTLNVASYMKSISADLVQNELSEYLNDGNSYLSVDGFFVFRLKGLMDDIKALLDVSIYENYVEEEYNDFVNFMKEIVAEQITGYDEIFLFENHDGFKILTDKGDDITEDCIGKNIKSECKNKNERMDAIISSIVAIAPKKIFIHCSAEMFDSAFCDLLRGIFSGRVIKC